MDPVRPPSRRSRRLLGRGRVQKVPQIRRCNGQPVCPAQCPLVRQRPRQGYSPHGLRSKPGLQSVAERRPKRLDLSLLTAFLAGFLDQHHIER